MMKVIFCVALFFIGQDSILAQTAAELEKQRQQIKKEIDETQNLLKQNKNVVKNSLNTYSIMAKKVDLQDRVIQTIDKDLHLLDNNIYGIQKDVNKYDRLLDTLKQEYAKSMVYAYKNRGNYEFMNFIFSANNFNDAVKRITYLKSYRTYRQMQGENILRTQELRKNRLAELGVSKDKKRSTLEIQNEEKEKLEEQKQQQDKIVVQLKKEGKDLNSLIVAKQKQMAKISASIKAAIAKAIKEENDRRIAAEKADKKRRDDLAVIEKAKRAADAKKLAEENRLAKIKNDASIAAGKPATAIIKPTIIEPKKTVEPAVEPEYKNLNSENIALNNSFERNRGSLPWPVDNGYILYHYGPNTFKSGAKFQNDGVTISSPIGTSVKAVFDGKVILIAEPETDKFMVTVQHGGYYTSYVNMSNVTVKMNQEIKTGQILGKVAANDDGIGIIDFKNAKGYSDLDPEKWLRKR